MSRRHNHNVLTMIDTIDHIVLDIDSTIIDSDQNLNIYPRPHLKKFIEFLFENFKSVSIWTAADESWLADVYETVLVPLLPEGKDFNLLLSKKHTKKLYTSYSSFIRHKPLSYMYSICPEMNQQNTIIIDDSPHNFHENPNNGFTIKPFSLYNPDDKELLYVIKLLKEYGFCD